MPDILLCFAMQAFAEPSHQAGSTVAAPNDQEAAFLLSASAAQQQHADGSAVAVAQQAPASREDGQLAASQHAGSMADVTDHDAEESNAQQAVGQKVDAAPQGGGEHFHVSSPQYDDDPANPDGKLMSLLMG